jgi:hypothetical protein
MEGDRQKRKAFSIARIGSEAAEKKAIAYRLLHIGGEHARNT